ncbi:MAG: TonB-dependent receptor [Luteolibacter sp.]
MKHQYLKPFLFSHFVAATSLASAQPASTESSAQDSSSGTTQNLEELVITATGIGESVTNVPQTIRSYDIQEITESAPRQLTDFFRSQGLGQVQEFGVGHSTVNLRGASTAGSGQGWSDASEVSVLINGRSSGTANLGKISLHDVENIEVLRGPNSVLYGSSALGGVINIITKDGQTFEGTELTTIFSSFNRYSQIIQHGGKQGAFDYYVELSATASGDYDTGRGSIGKQPNTDYKQRSANITLGYDINDRHRIELLFRQDGIYHAGHPGATYSLTDYDNRYGTTVELKYTGSTINDQVSWTNQLFYNRDVDSFHWSQNPLIGLIPAIGAPGLIGTPGITQDVNTRELQEWGNRFSANINLARQNTLTAGFDLKYSELDNHRDRTAAPGYLGALLGIPVDLPPIQANAEILTSGIFLQDSHRFLDEKLTARLGGRYDRIYQKALPTENSSITEDSQSRDAFVYQGGFTYNPLKWLTLRGNVGTGFLSANPSQLFLNTQQGNGFIFLANPDLKDEKSFGWDIGARVNTGSFNFDISLYETKIKDYVTAQLVGGTSLQWQNADEKLVRGIEINTAYDLAPALGWEGYTLETYLSGNYYLKKDSVGIDGQKADQAFLNDYNVNIGIRGGGTGKWSANLYATFAGHSQLAAGFLQNADVPSLTKNYDIPKYGILNFSANYQLTNYANLFAGVNNILDKNYSVNYYALNNSDTDVAGYLLPGTASGVGFSSPGREFYGGVSFKF